ncbi:MAG TPA: universal stress protein [Myxococcales bacterium]|nr:universal stress protein [Myxococcales bacterium]
MWRKICCAIDLSPHSDAVVRAASGMARRFGAGLVLVNVEEMPVESALYSQPEVLEAERCSRQYALEERKRAATDLSGAEVDTATLADHDAVARVVDFARDAACDLIVVGARAASRHSPFESFAEKIVRRSPCSVLVVRNPCA